MQSERHKGEGRAAIRLLTSRPAGAVALLGLVLASLAGAGCRNHDVLENELRARDFQYRDLLDDLKKSECHNDALQREIEAMRRGSKITPEEAAQNFGLKRVVLGRLTMGVDNDKVPGDEALQVIVEPQDVDGHTIKVPATIQVTAQEINAQGIKFPLAIWDINQDQVRRSWKQGMFGTGYYFTLPWQTWPKYENIRVTVRFVLSDNRLYEADKDIKIRLGPGPREMLPQPKALPEESPGCASSSNRSPFDADVRASQPAAPASRCRWQPVPLGDSVGLGRPEVVE